MPEQSVSGKLLTGENEMAEDFFYRRQIIEILGIDESFLHELEKEDLVSSVELESSRERVFTRDQAERIRIIDNLVRELEVNLAGVEVILEMRANMLRMQRQFDTILQMMVEQLRGKVSW